MGSSIVLDAGRYMFRIGREVREYETAVGASRFLAHS